MSSGFLRNVTVDTYSSSVVADTAAGATVLTLARVGDFQGGAGQVLVNGTQYAFLSVNPDTATMLLDDPLTVAVPADSPVTLLTAQGVPARRWTAYVDDDTTDPLPCTIPAPQLTPYFREGESQAGTLVTYDVVDGTYVVTSAPNDAPQFDGGVVTGSLGPGVDVSGATGLPVIPGQVTPTTSPALQITSLGGNSFAIFPLAASASDRLLIYAGLPGFVVDDSNILANGVRGAIQRTALPDGTPFDPSVVYEFFALAYNDAGYGPAGPRVQAQLQPLSDDNIAELSVDKLTSGTFSAVVALLGAIMVGSSIQIDPVQGITITQTNGKVTRLPADGSPNVFAGLGKFDSLATLAAAFNGAVQVNSSATLSNGVGDPVNPPTVSAAWDSLAITGQTSTSTQANRMGLLDDGTRWLTTANNQVQAISKSTGAVTTVATLPKLTDAGGAHLVQARGITKIGTSYYVLVNNLSGAAGDHAVYIYDSSFTKTGQWLWTSPNAPVGTCTITTDGTNVLLAWPYGLAGVFRAGYAPYVAASGVSAGSATDVPHDQPGDHNLTGAYYGTAGGLFSQPSFVYSRPDRINGDQKWPLASGVARGVAFSNGVMHTLGDSAVWDYTTIYDTLRFVAQDKRDTNATGGTARTLAKGATFTPTKFAKCVITADDPMWDGTANGADSVGIFVGSTLPTRTLQAVISASPWAAVFTSFTTTGAAPNTGTNEFVGRPGALGTLVSSNTDTVGAINRLQGDGPGRTGWNRWNATGAKIESLGLRGGSGTPAAANNASTLLAVGGTSDHDGGGFSYSSSVVTVPNSGVYSVSASVTFDSNIMGRRVLGIETFVSATVGNGTALAIDGRAATPTGVTSMTTSAAGVYIAAGTTLRAFVRQDSGATVNLRNDLFPAQLNVERIG